MFRSCMQKQSNGLVSWYVHDILKVSSVIVYSSSGADYDPTRPTYNDEWGYRDDSD